MGKLDFFIVLVFALFGIMFGLQRVSQTTPQPPPPPPPYDASEFKGLEQKVDSLEAKIQQTQTQINSLRADVIIDEQALQTLLNQLEIPPENQVPITNELRRQGYRLAPSEETYERDNAPVRPPIDSPHEGA